MIAFTEKELAAIASLCRREVALRIEGVQTLRMYQDMINKIVAYLAPEK
jgi:hypothetical protein